MSSGRWLTHAEEWRPCWVLDARGLRAAHTFARGTFPFARERGGATNHGVARESTIVVDVRV